MKLVCVVKFVPDVDRFEYDHEKHVLIREGSRMMINPDDGCAIGFALEMKKRNPEIFIEVLTMAPASVVPLVEDILRVGVDQGTIISDRSYAGSDSWVTSRILGRYLATTEYDCILTGSQAIDGDTSHVPPQLGEILGLGQISGITTVEEDSFCSESAVVEVDDEEAVTTYELNLPAILSFSRKSKCRLPHVRFKDRKKDVTDRIKVLSNDELGFAKGEVGLKGSLTKVAKAYTRKYESGAQLRVAADDNGVETVLKFLKEKRFL
ncbi:electron transfer flavoprotein subunit beta/FixA family protein [Pseudovibrio sp. SPO723]|uniref:electron transfer flavoprotein subunit beta/FixA family protein n=1 Tax=Nesiotobacter zosterae TaxID=392721 RepID=UPI0029C3B402|nr:electron transfer flavoprotein subunit beta/FixA family protein [Pseudovibrio sp. SPO723]MDX5594342.1 electron transfer flavoprotein subunit beta/FixA family protein [Pseudovibrio sp. SPO723]